MADVLARSGLPRTGIGEPGARRRNGPPDGLHRPGDARCGQIGAGYVPDARRGQLALPMAVAEAPAAGGCEGPVGDNAGRIRHDGALPGWSHHGTARHELRGVHSSDTLQSCCEGDVVRVAGRVVRRQRPLARAVFLTLEDEFGLIPVAVWEQRWETLKHVLRRPLVVIEGEISRRDNTLNVMAERAWPLRADLALHAGSGHDWR
ncbi:Error-prone DNA polymerase [Geodia barretti]|uniref:Error-prone DNA polymerase n=1 Tax=Geodia barretti TaxID=519541 RepID=A0AA35R0K4_GEOBA|nr:Error-prone DNA polymerase [Geodia barretti]